MQVMSAPSSDHILSLPDPCLAAPIVVIKTYLDHYQGLRGPARQPRRADPKAVAVEPVRASGANGMDEATFRATKQKLDLQIDKLGYDPKVGILMGIDLYTEFRRRGLLKDAIADFRLWKFTLQGYRDLFVTESTSVASDDFRLGR